MGHLGIDNLRKLKKVATAVDFNDTFGPNCIDCILANQSRQPRVGSTADTATAPYEVIYTDLWGPALKQSINGNTYMMTVINDFTRTVRVFFLKYKSEAIIYIKAYISEAVTIGFLVNSIRMDNGGEYSSRDLYNWLQ